MRNHRSPLLGIHIYFNTSLPSAPIVLVFSFFKPQTVKPSSTNARREAYATILHSEDVYVCGAIVAAQSIRLSGSTRDLIILVDETISSHYKNGLEAAGEYDKIIFIDADLLVLRNIDFLFTMPEISATGNNGTLFNSGVMVVEPSKWWHRIPRHMNFLKHFWIGDGEEKKSMKTRWFAAEPPVLYVLHYLGFKPWMCFRDYDCNWNVDFMQEFASDVAHQKWWRVHDLMPKKLQKYCLLGTHRKANLEWDRRQAEKANYSDGHWKLNVTVGGSEGIGNTIEDSLLTADEVNRELQYLIFSSNIKLIPLHAQWRNIHHFHPSGIQKGSTGSNGSLSFLLFLQSAPTFLKEDNVYYQLQHYPFGWL